MATACFCGLPESISFRIFELIVAREEPFLSGNLTSVTCLACGEQFFVKPYRASTARFCSRPCYDKIRKQVVTLTCAVCAKPFQRSPSKVLYERSVCSNACRGVLKRTEKPGSAKSYRRWLERRGLLMRCEKCGYDAHPEILVAHHRNRDRSVNDFDNLAILCPNCHALEHYGS